VFSLRGPFGISAAVLYTEKQASWRQSLKEPGGVCCGSRIERNAMPDHLGAARERLQAVVRKFR
jgi:hypothetical protein